MIKRVSLKNIASYTADEQMVEPFKVNFLFGLNGSGKTTLSRYLASPADEKYHDCQMDWYGTPIKCAVYNRDFVKDNFNETVPGIFTLGEGTIETKELIKRLTDEIAELDKIKDSKMKELDGAGSCGGYKKQLQNHEDSYAIKFWDIKQKLDREKSPMLKAITGVLGSKERFKEKVLSENISNKSELLDKASLEEQSARLFDASAEKVPTITSPSFADILSYEDDEMLKTIVVGKENVVISGLIQKLGNSSWFSQGVQYLSKSDGVCPFCQQKLPEDFGKQIEEYFDATYKNNIKKIASLKHKYDLEADRIAARLQELVDSPNNFLKTALLEKDLTALKTKIESNKKKLSDKVSTPNNTVSLVPLKEVAESIEMIIGNANESIREHNAHINNIKDAKEKLTSKVWKYILTQLSADIGMYSTRKTEIEKCIMEAETELDDAEKKREIKSRELREAEEKLTSIIPTAKGINEILESYGFNGFKLKVDEINKTYQFVRADGEPAFKSLSEGERNFVTFLYFIHTLKGNIDESGHEEDKVLVIDDPVSSLDNDVLFLVSTLIRDLFEDVYNDKGVIKQILVLSHNLYFFKEVSFDRGLKKENTGYWMITKSGNASKITAYRENPVSSTYEMLWDEVIQANENSAACNTLTLANAMRRIIEYYFKFLGGEDLSKFHRQFPDGDRQIFKSLISWMNSGSHSAFDDFSATATNYGAEKHLAVFRELFNKTNHISHYNMMMKIKAGEETHG